MNKTDQIFCPIRQIWVLAQPEECVRQSLIQQMTQQWGYPLGGLAVEKELHQMPHLSSSPLPLPKRRADLVFFAKGTPPYDSLYPLLLIECKAVKLTSKVIRQVIGYNFYLQAYFIALANQKEVLLGWYDQSLQNFSFIPYIPSYQKLLAIRCFN